MDKIIRMGVWDDSCPQSESKIQRSVNKDDVTIRVTKFTNVRVLCKTVKEERSLYNKCRQHNSDLYWSVLV